MTRQSVLLTTFFKPKDAVKRALNPDLHFNLGDVQARTDKANRTIVLQIVRVVDAEKLHLHLPIDSFKGADRFEDVIERDQNALAKLILFLA